MGLLWGSQQSEEGTLVRPIQVLSVWGTRSILKESKVGLYFPELPFVIRAA